MESNNSFSKETVLMKTSGNNEGAWFKRCTYSLKG